MAISIIPLLNVSEAVVRDIGQAVGNSFLSRVDILPPVSRLPESSYDKEREQYNARELVRFLDEQYISRGRKILAVCNLDLFAGGLNFVYGVAQLGGGIALISLYRLDQRFYSRPADYTKLIERAVKEAVHELGHSYGLEHCGNSGCVMRFSNNIVAVDRKGASFCGDCRENLRKRL